MNRMPPHIEMLIRKNPNAVLTERGVVLKRTDRIDELLTGIPDADKLYGEHFDEIKAEQAENLASVQPVKQEAVETKVETDSPETSTEDADKEETPVIKQESVDDVAFPGAEDTSTIKETSDRIQEANGGPDPFDTALAEAKQNPKYANLSEEEIVKRVKLSLAAKERAAQKKSEEAK